MMKFLLSASFALFLCSGLFAQNKKIVVVKAGTKIMNVFPLSEIFYYPQFTVGTVFFNNGTPTAAAEMNYDRLVDEMHFISPKGDTLSMANEKNIAEIVIGTDTFYYNEGYLRLLSSGNLLKLAIKQVWVIAEARQIGAYNTTNGSVSITSFSSLSQGGSLYDLTVNEDLVLKKTEALYLGDTNGHFVLAGKKNLLALFPNEHSRIETYLKENKINFTDRDDLEKLTGFL